MKQPVQTDSNPDELTILSSRTTIRGGSFTVDHDLTVRGVLHGDVHVGGRIDVRQKAKVEGTLHAREAVVAGHVSGDVHVDGTLWLRSTGVVDGKIRAHRVAVEEGASGSFELAITDDEAVGDVAGRRLRALDELAAAMERARASVSRSEVRGDTSATHGSSPQHRPWSNEIAVTPQAPRSSSVGDYPLARKTTDDLIRSREIRDFAGLAEHERSRPEADRVTEEAEGPEGRRP